jgi:hypothetical protein
VKAIAGPPPADSYSTDESGKMSPNYRPDTTVSRLERIAQHALEGLAAGSQVHRPGANALAGMGAGFQAQQQQAQGQDLIARGKAKEQFEQEQKALTDKAIRAGHNASTYSLWQKSIDEGNDHDPDRAKNLDVQHSLEDYIARNPATDMQVAVISDKDAMAMREQDAHTIANHTFLPLGTRQTKQDGKPVFQGDGVTPKMEGQVLLISGKLDNGKVPLPC